MKALESEAAVIGCALAFPDQVEATESVRPEHFSEPLHNRIWSVIESLSRRGLCPDPTLVAQEIAGAELDAVGGLAYLTGLLDRAVLWSLTGHVDVVIDRAMRRKIAAASKEATTRAGMIDVPAAEVLSDLERAAAEIGRASGPLSRAAGLDALDMLENARNGAHAGQKVGLGCIDLVTGGIQPDAVWIVGARTSMGKSVVLPTLGRGLAEAGRGVLFFSLEMPRREVQARLIADLAHDQALTAFGADDPGNIRFSDILTGRARSIQWQRAEGGAKRLASLPFVVSDKGGLSLDEITAEARRQVRAWERAGVKPGAILIDHLGLVKCGSGRDSKAAEVADMVDRLKDAAKRIGAPIIAAAQLNRNAENRNDHKPLISDLNWSGSIEQIADLVALLYRPAYYLRRDGQEAEAIARDHELEILIPKNRSGPTCSVHAWIDVACNAVRDVPAEDQRRAWA